ncbi:MAG: RNA 2',3'-cyclic phosphodiesterase [Candidatus Woesearchaeota archaeon]
MRLFLAVNVPDEYHKIIEEFQDSIKGIQGTKNKHYHFTLYFFGEKTEKEMQDIIEKLSAINFERFKNEEVIVKDLGFFDNRVLFLKGYNLENLYNEVISFLKLPKENFQAHLTLYRIKKLLNSKENIIKLKSPEFKFKMNLHLIESRLDLHQYFIKKTFF